MTPLNAPAMKLLLSFIFSFSISCSLLAQQDSIPPAKNLSTMEGLGVWIDYGKLLTMPTSFETKWQIGIDYSFKNRFMPFISLGQTKFTPEKAHNNLDYESEGWYVNGGITYKLPIDGKSILYLGGAYGISRYKESGVYYMESSLFDDFVSSYSRSDLTASWASLVIGSEKQLGTGNWKVGGLFSLRMMIQYDEFEPIDSYAIPGYGRSFNNTVPALNLYIKYIF